MALIELGFCFFSSCFTSKNIEDLDGPDNEQIGIAMQTKVPHDLSALNLVFPNEV